jgi:membrane associated rhomboid family serine protease
MNPQMLRVLSAIFFQAGIFSILLSIFIWWYLGSDEPDEQAHAERFGIFVGLWAPTLLILSNRFDRFADKATVLPALKPEHQEERGEG